jgi:tRNA(fMet)-specific endonuclease VapC
MGRTMIIIDTDVLIEIFDKKSIKGDDAVNKIESSGEDIAITAINLHEILYGLYKSSKKKIEGLDQIQTIEFDREDAKLAEKLEVQVEKEGHIIDRTDSMIASITINRKAKLFTFNQRHYQNIKQLSLF